MPLISMSQTTIRQGFDHSSGEWVLTNFRIESQNVICDINSLQTTGGFSSYKVYRLYSDSFKTTSTSAITDTFAYVISIKDTSATWNIKVYAQNVNIFSKSYGAKFQLGEVVGKGPVSGASCSVSNYASYVNNVPPGTYRIITDVTTSNVGTNNDYMLIDNEVITYNINKTLAITFGGISAEKVDENTVKVSFNVLSVTGKNVYNIQLSTDGKNFKTYAVVFPEGTQPNQTYTTTIKIN